MVGRKTIWTDQKIITADNVLDVLHRAIAVHLQNVADINDLLEYDAGNQPLQRTAPKTYRKELNYCVADNVAHEIVEFWAGYMYGNTPTYVQREKSEDREADFMEAVSRLNEGYEITGSSRDWQTIANFIEITGRCYTYIDYPRKWRDGDSYFTRDVLDPRWAFVVRSSFYIDHRIMAAVTYYEDEQKVRHYMVFTEDSVYEISEDKILSDEENILGVIPIIEWACTVDLTGVFERQISDMDNLNILTSDFTNNVEENTFAMWHFNDVEFEKEEVENEDGSVTINVKKPKSGDMIGTYTSKDGKTPFIKPLTLNYDYPGMLNNILSRRSLILQKCNVPQRNDNSGGSTGVAMSDATGWSAAETSACKRQLILESCMMEELKVVLAAIRECPDIEDDNPLLLLKARDLKPNIKRMKLYELATKTNSMATLLSHGFSLEDCVSTIPLFDDPSQTIARSGDGVRKYQETIYAVNDSGNESEGGTDEPAPNAERIQQDLSDQVENSPQIDKSRTSNF